MDPGSTDRQYKKWARLVLFSRLLKGRLSLMNLSRFLSCVTAKATEADRGSTDETGSAHAHLQRDILRAHARLGWRLTAKDQELSPGMSGCPGRQKFWCR